jgi:hypothetical protein
MRRKAERSATRRLQARLGRRTEPSATSCWAIRSWRPARRRARERNARCPASRIAAPTPWRIRSEVVATGTGVALRRRQLWRMCEGPLVRQKKWRPDGQIDCDPTFGLVAAPPWPLAKIGSAIQILTPTRLREPVQQTGPLSRRSESSTAARADLIQPGIPAEANRGGLARKRDRSALEPLSCQA